MTRFGPGEIVLVDWRRDGRLGEPNKLRPAIVVENSRAFSDGHATAILVPLSGDALMVIPGLALAIEPETENGCTKRCWALSYLVTTLSKTRLRGTHSRITPDQLQTVRNQVVVAVGAAPCPATQSA